MTNSSLDAHKYVPLCKLTKWRLNQDDTQQTKKNVTKCEREHGKAKEKSTRFVRCQMVWRRHGETGTRMQTEYLRNVCSSASHVTSRNSMQIKSKWITLQRSDKHNASAWAERRGEAGEWAEKNAEPWTASVNSGHLLVEALTIQTVCSARCTCEKMQFSQNHHRSLERCSRSFWTFWFWTFEWNIRSLRKFLLALYSTTWEELRWWWWRWWQQDVFMFARAHTRTAQMKSFLGMSRTEQEPESRAARSSFDAFVFETPATLESKSGRV